MTGGTFTGLKNTSKNLCLERNMHFSWHFLITRHFSVILLKILPKKLDQSSVYQGRNKAENINLKIIFIWQYIVSCALGKALKEKIQSEKEKKNFKT